MYIHIHIYTHQVPHGRLWLAQPYRLPHIYVYVFIYIYIYTYMYT